MKSSVIPMPKSEDFRVNELSDADIASIKKSYEVEVHDKIVDTQKDILNRLLEAISHMRDILWDNEKIFHASSNDKIEELLKLAPQLNVMNDPDLADTINKLQSLSLHKDDLKIARESPLERTRMAKKCDKSVETIMNNLGGYIG